MKNQQITISHLEYVDKFRELNTKQFDKWLLKNGVQITMERKYLDGLYEARYDEKPCVVAIRNQEPVTILLPNGKTRFKGNINADQNIMPSLVTDLEDNPLMIP